MKTILAISLACFLAACATDSRLADTPSYTINNPDGFGTNPPLNDDDGNVMPVVPKRPTAATARAAN